MSRLAAIALLIVLTATLLSPPPSVEAHRRRHRTVCPESKSFAFRFLGGRPVIAAVHKKRINGRRCVKVLSATVEETYFRTRDCKECHKNAKGKWKCSRMPRPAASSRDKPHCKRVRGPDCKWYLVNRKEKSEPCL